MNTNKVVFIRLFEYLNCKKYEKTCPIKVCQLRILMHSIELVFNNKRNIPSTPPPSTPPPSTPPLSTHLPSTHPPSTHPPSTHPQCPSKTKSKALLSIVRRIQNPQRHHQFFHHRRHPLCRCSSDPENPESNSNKRKWIGSSYIWNHGYVSWSRRSFQWVGTSLCLVLMYSVKQTITDRRNRPGTDSVERIECLHHLLNSDIVAKHGSWTEQVRTLETNTNSNELEQGFFLIHEYE